MALGRENTQQKIKEVAGSRLGDGRNFPDGGREKTYGVTPGVWSGRWRMMRPFTEMKNSGGSGQFGLKGEAERG